MITCPTLALSNDVDLMPLTHGRGNTQNEDHANDVERAGNTISSLPVANPAQTERNSPDIGSNLYHITNMIQSSATVNVPTNPSPQPKANDDLE